MTPNQTQLRRAELYLQDVDNGCNEVKTLRALIQQAKSAPAEVAQGEAVAAQVRFRRPEKTSPGWSIWQPAAVSKSTPAWCIDIQGYEVEYRLLYTAPPGIDPALTSSQCACGDEYPENSYGAGFMAANNGVCENCDTDTAPPSPDAELVASMADWSERISKVWIGHAHIDELITIQREIDAKLARLNPRT